VKLKDLYEMTMRVGDLNLPDLDISQISGEFVGKMEGGLEVFEVSHDDTKVFYAMSDDQIATFTQVREISVPSIGLCLESLVSKTGERWRGQRLNYKLKFFIVKHLGHSMVLGPIHSSATQAVLNKIADRFEMSLVDMISGETVPWSVESYKKLTSVMAPTKWRVLLKAPPISLKESAPLVFWDGDRPLWTYGAYFDDVDPGPEDSL
jgi:hypothetical protein